jgi:hypothetical protein
MDSQQAQPEKVFDCGAGGGRITIDDLTHTLLDYMSDEPLAKMRTENPDLGSEEEMMHKESLNVEITPTDLIGDQCISTPYQAGSQDFEMSLPGARIR